MRFGLMASNPLEWLLVKFNLIARPVLDTQVAGTYVHVIMAAVKVGLFDALADGPATAEKIAAGCGTHPDSTAKLLPALAASGYLRARGDQYELSPLSRKWLVTTSPHAVNDKLLLQFYELGLMQRADEYLRSGKPLDFHTGMSDDVWDSYQRGMKCLTTGQTDLVAKAIPVPEGATDMLDIGGSHGAYSVALCRRHPSLSAVVLDLPDAVRHAAPLLAEEGMGDRVRHRAGNALTDDFGEECYDAVVIIGVAHHFSDEQNRELAAKVTRALRPNGVYTIAEFPAASGGGKTQQLAALRDFYFALASESGTWSPSQMASWQRAAGLRPAKTVRLAAGGGLNVQSGRKPR
ncbi:methyltransferase [Streptomyces sp. NBC_01020]|uniref:methyltransferase n=1 Tax=Streptomyces sp. NBC_01020 TaxID=2903722 RepID=UPI0038677C8D|nr:methyltransferase [Streptomyces sp. NBC_01020]